MAHAHLLHLRHRGDDGRAHLPAAAATAAIIAALVGLGGAIDGHPPWAAVGERAERREIIVSATTAPPAAAAATPMLPPGDQLSAVEIPKGMHLRRIWVVDEYGQDAAAAAVDAGNARFDGLPAGRYVVA